MPLRCVQQPPFAFYKLPHFTLFRKFWVNELVIIGGSNYSCVLGTMLDSNLSADSLPLYAE